MKRIKAIRWGFVADQTLSWASALLLIGFWLYVAFMSGVSYIAAVIGQPLPAELDTSPDLAAVLLTLACFIALTYWAHWALDWAMKKIAVVTNWAETEDRHHASIQ